MRAQYEECYNSEIVELLESDDESQMTNEALQHMQVVKLLLLPQ